MKVGTPPRPLQPPAVLLQTAMLTWCLAVAAAGPGAVLVPAVPATSFEACRAPSGGERSDGNLLSLKLPLFLAVNSEETLDLSIELYFQWINDPLTISFEVKDNDRLRLVATAPVSSFSIPVQDEGWISVIFLPSGENALLLAVQSENEHSKDGVVTVRSVLIKDLSHVAAGQAVNITSSSSSALDVQCLQHVADETSTEAMMEESSPKVGPSLPLHVVVPVVICVVFIVVILALSALFIWQRYELKKRKNSYQQTILRKQEELQQFNHTHRDDDTPQVPPRTPYNSSQRTSFLNSDDEESRQLRPTGSGSGSEMISAPVHPRPRSYVRDKSRPPLVHQISNNSDANKSQETNKKFESISKIIKGCPLSSSNITSKRTSESKELSCMNDKSNQQNTIRREADEEEEGGFNGPYWHHSLRQPPSKILKTFQV